MDGQGDPNAVFIFQAGSALSAEIGSRIALTNGTQACNVFWQVGSSATLKTNSIFKGSILALEAISLQDGASVEGRLLARNAAVTLIHNNITKPTCAAAAAAAATGSMTRTGNINVVKIVINDGGGTKTIADFPLYLNGARVVSGVTNTFPAPAGYFVMENADPKYTTTFSGDCDRSGLVNLNSNDNKFCVVTNNDKGVPIVTPPVPPLIDVVKVPSPLALPAGPGPVTYTYTLRNIGTVPVTNITMVGDTCTPINLVSGDLNNDSKLDVSETWIYRCSTTLSATHTNIVTTTGWANGISVVDIASATVVVGASVVPPLIHITKVPNPLTLLAGGGMVTYTKKVTNPGTVALSNVQIIDDTCIPVKYISGDANNDSKLDTAETWTYTCSAKLTQTTTNTATVTGEANGLTARDFAIAHVVVATAAPKLPNTGVGPTGIYEFIQNFINNFSHKKEQANFNLPVVTDNPARLKISKINVDAIIEYVGLTSGGAMEAPKGSANVAWFKTGFRPGDNGSAVMSGHYGRWKNGGGSVFDDLNKLEKGDKLYVEDKNGITTTFVVRELRTYEPDADASDVFSSSDGKAHLNLITCDGDWNEVLKTYSKRLVIFTDLL